jgi:S1-C subfamily serine protease
MRKILTFLLLFPLLVYSQREIKTNINWTSLEVAKKNNKNILVYFYKQDCEYCEKMEQTSLSDHNVSRLINQTFSTVKIDSRTKDIINYNGKDYSNQQPVEHGYTWRHDFYAEVASFEQKGESMLTTPSIVLFNNNFQKIKVLPGHYPSKLLLKKLIEFNNSYPTVQQKPINTNNDNWLGNGTGFFISNSGYIVTNNHVIDGASEIEIEFKYNSDIKSFNAKIIKTDKINDLAIIKIDDPKFSNLSTIPYNFKSRSSAVGTEVFALGYPMALSLMGKDIKFTDGKISSKTGLGGDITTYQIQVPIQPGNSGGPLFDTNCNLVGITSSTINRKLDLTENVNYAIKSSYLLNLIDVLPEEITLPSSTQLASIPLTEQIKVLSDYVVLIKVK